MDIAELPRAFPQFGRSVRNLVRTRREVFMPTIKPSDSVSWEAGPARDCGGQVGGNCGCGGGCACGNRCGRKTKLPKFDSRVSSVGQGGGVGPSRRESGRGDPGFPVGPGDPPPPREPCPIGCLGLHAQATAECSHGCTAKCLDVSHMYAECQRWMALYGHADVSGCPALGPCWDKECRNRKCCVALVCRPLAGMSGIITGASHCGMLKKDCHNKLTLYEMLADPPPFANRQLGKYVYAIPSLGPRRDPPDLTKYLAQYRIRKKGCWSCGNSCTDNPACAVINDDTMGDYPFKDTYDYPIANSSGCKNSNTFAHWMANHVWTDWDIAGEYVPGESSWCPDWLPGWNQWDSLASWDENELLGNRVR